MIFMFLSIVLFSVSLCSARPNGDASPKNMITVPPNCKPGQQWINGECRDIWMLRYPNLFPANNFQPKELIGPKNVVTVPTNCDEGQQWINGECREVWTEANPVNMITVPTNCPEGQQYINGQCRDIWRRSQLSPEFQNSVLLSSFINSYYDKDVERNKRQVYTDEDGETEQFGDLHHDPASRNIISVPNQCPSGFRPDALGICREIFD